MVRLTTYSAIEGCHMGTEGQARRSMPEAALRGFSTFKAKASGPATDLYHWFL
jgi:hypothetical protein